jgi:hypothetical protein
MEGLEEGGQVFLILFNLYMGSVFLQTNKLANDRFFIFFFD